MWANKRQVMLPCPGSASLSGAACADTGPQTSPKPFVGDEFRDHEAPEQAYPLLVTFLNVQKSATPQFACGAVMAWLAVQGGHTSTPALQ